MEDNRYANGKIYRLVNNVDSEEYVGSTCGKLSKRLYGHKSGAKKTPLMRVYSHLNEVGWDNVKIVLVEEYKCENKMELERRERYWIESLKPSLNMNVPTRSVKEWCVDNADKMRKNLAKYRAENPDKVRESSAKYRAENPDKRRETCAKYRENNREKLLEYNREYMRKKRQANTVSA